VHVERAQVTAIRILGVTVQESLEQDHHNFAILLGLQMLCLALLARLPDDALLVPHAAKELFIPAQPCVACGARVAFSDFAFDIA